MGAPALEDAAGGRGDVILKTRTAPEFIHWGWGASLGERYIVSRARAPAPHELEPVATIGDPPAHDADRDGCEERPPDR